MTDIPKKTGLYIGPELHDLLADHTAAGRSISSTINTIADRYQETVRRSMPRFSLGEWCLIFDSLNGYFARPASTAVGGIAINVSDGVELDRLDEKWDVDGRALVEKLRSMSWPQLLAILDASERWWAATNENTATVDESIPAIVGEHNVSTD